MLYTLHFAKCSKLTRGFHAYKICILYTHLENSMSSMLVCYSEHSQAMNSWVSDGRETRWKRLISRLQLGQYFGDIINTVYLKKYKFRTQVVLLVNLWAHKKKVYRKGMAKDFDDDIFLYIFVYKLMHFSIIRCADQT